MMSHPTPPTARKTIRLQSLEYTEPHLYYLTFCTHGREPLLGEIVDGRMQLSECGRIVEEEWLRSGDIRPELLFDAYVIMPDHMHALLGIAGSADADLRAHCRAALHPEGTHRGSRDRPPRSVSSFMAQFKAYTSKRINEWRGAPGQRVWQPRFNDHVVRIAEPPEQIRAYIAANPQRWRDRHGQRS